MILIPGMRLRASSAADKRIEGLLLKRYDLRVQPGCLDSGTMAVSEGGLILDHTAENKQQGPSFTCDSDSGGRSSAPAA